MRKAAAILVTILTRVLVAWATTAGIEFETEYADVCSPNADEQACLASFAPLHFSGGVEIKANSTHFGGLSSLLVSFDARRFGSVTDAGWLVTGELKWDRGFLNGLQNGQIGNLLGLDGEGLGGRSDPTGKELWDAESLAAYNTTHPLHGDILVSFERQHRVWRYKFGSEGHRAIPSHVSGLSGEDSKISVCPHNGGAEAMEMLRDGRIMVLCEESILEQVAEPVSEGEGSVVTEVLGWVVGSDGLMQELRYLIRDGLSPVALARIPASDDLLLLERKWTPEEGNTIRVRHVTERALLLSLVSGCVISAGLVAELNAELHQVDNFEGLAIIPGFPRHRRPILPGAGTRRSEGEDELVEESDSERLEVLMVSDDNFADTQRTLLFSFHVNRTVLPGASCLAHPTPDWAIGGVAILVAVPALSVCVCFVMAVVAKRAEKTGRMQWLVNIFRGEQRFEMIDNARPRQQEGTELAA